MFKFLGTVVSIIVAFVFGAAFSGCAIFLFTNDRLLVGLIPALIAVLLFREALREIWGLLWGSKD